MEQSIKIQIAGYTFPLKVTSAEQEENIRKSAQEINRQIAAYQNRYQNKSLVEILSIIALNRAIVVTSLKKHAESIVNAEECLLKELDGYLDNIDKNSR